MTPTFRTSSVTTASVPHRVVRASAGTGKTYDLSTRYLSLLRHGVAVDTILATTFTRKAAGEILGRVLLRLAKAAQDDKDAAALGKDLCAPALTRQDCRRMLGEVCRHLHRVSVSTIDSFFHGAATCFRYELGLPPEMRVAGDDDPMVVRLRHQAIDALLGDDEMPQLLDLLRRLHHDQATRRVTQAIDEIVGGEAYHVFRQNPCPDLWPRLETHVAGQLTGHALTDAIEKMRCLGPKLPRDKRWAKAWQTDLDASQSSDWDAFLNRGLAKTIAVAGPDACYCRRPMPESVVAVYEPLIQHAQAILVHRVLHQTQATYRLLQRFDHHFMRLREAHGIFLYSDIPLKLAAATQDADGTLMLDLYYRLDRRVTHLLLDEFQDTSLQQWQILRPLAQEICAHSDGSRTFYCVGDLKQAIYGWRGGRAEIFCQIERDLHLDPGSKESKNVSYRSSQAVLDAVNRVFGSIASNEAVTKAQSHAQVWQERFQCHEAHDAHRPGYVELVTSSVVGCDGDADDDDDDAAKPSSLAHELAVAQKIAQIAANAPGQSMGVLVNTNKAVGVMIDLLGRRGLPVSGEGGNLLTDDAAVGVILAALRLADHPGHAVAAFHVLHSPLGPFVGLGSIGPSDTHTVALAIRRVLLSRGYGGVISDWSRQLAPACGLRNIQRLSQLVELAHRHDRAITLRPIDFVTFVESTPVQEPSPAPIRVMTINKAKGLEFDIVVLPDLHRRLLDESRVLLCVDQDLRTGNVQGVYRNAAAHVRAICPELERAYDQRLSRQFHDDLCKLYVAMTRARHALHMVIRPLRRNLNGQPGAQGWRTPSFAAILRRALCDDDAEETVEGGQTLYHHGDPHWAGHHRPIEPTGQTQEPNPIHIRLAPSPGPRKPRRTWCQVSPSSLESAGRIRGADLLAIQTSDARLRGTLIHAWFEQIGFVGADGSATGLRDDELCAIARRVAMGKDSGWITQQLDRFKGMLAHPTVRTVLARPEVENDSSVDFQLWRERAFAVNLDGRLLRGKFDRVVVWEQAGKPLRADLVDFKTDHVSSDTLTEAVERYRPQLRAYQSALSTMLQLDASAVDARLLFVECGQVVRE